MMSVNDVVVALMDAPFVVLLSVLYSTRKFARALLRINFICLIHLICYLGDGWNNLFQNVNCIQRIRDIS
jgi:hypothetical protein